MTKPSNSLRAIPAVEKVLQAIGSSDFPRPVVVALVRRELAALRLEEGVLDFDGIIARIRARLESLRRSRIQPVINGTGILVHTNLGRSPLGAEIAKTLSEVATQYNNLEYDLDTGERGGRAGYLENNLALLCEAEAATVVNNCASALVLILRHLAYGERNEVIISRSELVQIGGGFRIPEILEASGAKLREVGTTNKTSVNDYENAISARTGLILKVHQSNFFMEGFVESPSPESIAALARKSGIPFVEDLGSGAMISTENFPGIEHEPTPMEVLGRGVDLVCFSGDKLFGGPQAGIIAGRTQLVSALKREPFFRALRCDKLILSALQTAVELYLAGSGEGMAGNPVLGMMALSIDELRLRAEKIIAAISELRLKVSVGEGKSQIGGGTLPRSTLSSVTVDVIPLDFSLEKLASSLRTGRPPIIGFISGGRFKIDLRTVFPSQDQMIVEGLAAVTRT